MTFFDASIERSHSLLAAQIKFRDSSDDALHDKSMEANKEGTRLSEVFKQTNKGRRWKELLKKTTLELRIARRENAELQGELDNASKTLNAWKELQIEDHLSQNKMIQLQSARRKIQDMGWENDQLNQELDLSVKKIRTLKEQICVKDRESEEYRDEMQSIVERIVGENSKTVQNGQDGVKVHIRALFASINEHLDANQSSNRTEVGGQSDKVRQQMDGEQKENQRVKAMASFFDSAEDNFELLNAENAALKHEMSDLVQIFDSEMIRKNEDIVATERQISKMQDLMKEMETRPAAKSRITTETEEFHKLKAENDRLRQQMEESQGEHQRVNAMAAFFDSVEDKEAIELLSAENAILKQEVADLVEKLDFEIARRNENAVEMERQMSKMHELMKEMESRPATQSVITKETEESYKLKAKNDRLWSRVNVDKKEIDRLEAVVKKSKLDSQQRQKEREWLLKELTVREQGLASLIALLRKEVDRLQSRFEDEGGDSNRTTIDSKRGSTINQIVDGLKLRLSSITGFGSSSQEVVAEELDNNTEIKAVIVDVIDVQKKMNNLMMTVAKNDEQQMLMALVSKLCDEVDRLKKKFPDDDDTENVEWERTVGMKRMSYIRAQKRKKKRERKLPKIKESGSTTIESIIKCTAEVVDVQEKVDSLWEMVKDEMDHDKERNLEIDDLEQKLKTADLMIDELRKESETREYAKCLDSILLQQLYGVRLDGTSDETGAFLVNKTKEKDNELKRLKVKLSENEKELVAMKQKVENRDSEFEEYRVSIESVFDRVSGDTESIVFSPNPLLNVTAKEGEIRTLNIRVSDYEQEIAALQQSLKTKDDEIEDQQIWTFKLDDEVTSLKETIKGYRVEMSDLKQSVKEGNQERERLQSFLKRKNEVSLQRESKMRELIVGLREEMDQLMATFEEEESSNARTELNLVQNVGLKPVCWIHPEAAKRRQSRDMIAMSELHDECAAAEQAVEIHWITEDVIEIQQQVIALLDAKKRLEQRPSTQNVSRMSTFSVFHEEKDRVNPKKSEKVKDKQKKSSPITSVFRMEKDITDLNTAFKVISAENATMERDISTFSTKSDLLESNEEMKQIIADKNIKIKRMLQMLRKFKTQLQALNDAEKDETASRRKERLLSCLQESESINETIITATERVVRQDRRSVISLGDIAIFVMSAMTSALLVREWNKPDGMLSNLKNLSTKARSVAFPKKE